MRITFLNGYQFRQFERDDPVRITVPGHDHHGLNGQTGKVQFISEDGLISVALTNDGIALVEPSWLSLVDNEEMSLEELAKKVESLKGATLFSDETPPPEACLFATQHFLAGIAALDLAYRSFALAALFKAREIAGTF